jgi:hypothetical protein
MMAATFDDLRLSAVISLDYRQSVHGPPRPWAR